MEERRREYRSLLALIALLVGIGVLIMAAGGCSGRAAAGGDWRFEESVEGNVKTVRTLGGSVWGGTARRGESFYRRRFGVVSVRRMVGSMKMRRDSGSSRDMMVIWTSPSQPRMMA